MHSLPLRVLKKASTGLARLRATLIHHFARHPFQRQNNQTRNNDGVIEVADDRQKIRDQVERHQRVTDGRAEQPARKARRLLMARDELISLEFTLEGAREVADLHRVSMVWVEVGDGQNQSDADGASPGQFFAQKQRG